MTSVAVGGCEYHEPHDPGNLQLDWLEVQLEIFRERGMHVRLHSDTFLVMIVVDASTQPVRRSTSADTSRRR